MDNSSQLFWGMLFGAIGLGYFTYGRKQHAIVPWISGVGMFIFPYFVSNPYLMVLIGMILCALPFIIRR